MAIDFISNNIVSVRRAQRAFVLATYIMREEGRDPISGRLYDFTPRAGDLLTGEVLVPEEARGCFSSPLELVAAMEEAERITERKTGERRFRENAQLARHVILALPKELSAKQRLDLAREWAMTQYVSRGAAVLMALHEADDPEIGNYHAHLLVSTRTIDKNGFSKRKARHLNPVFTRGKGQDWATLHKDDLPGQWRAFQNAYFRKHDIPLSVDPTFLIAGRHLGKARFLDSSDIAAENAAAREVACRRIREIPELLAFATRNAATFTRRSLAAILRRHDVPKDEAAAIIAAALADPEIVRLIDSATGKAGMRFTTRTVRSQERQILEFARGMAARLPGKKKLERLKAKAAEIARRLGLAAEQLEALMHCMAGGDLTLIRGVAGAGKSYTVQGIRETLEASGYRVVGLAPTNKVSVSMAVDGFGHAATLDLELLRQKGGRKGTIPWDANTCIIIDEAGMVNSALFELVLERAAAAGAKVILVGDQAQLASVARGGMFGVLKDQLGCAEIKEIRRQEEDWAKAASLDFAEGNIQAGLAAYADRGHLTFDDTLEDAIDALVRKWSADHDRSPETQRFVYAATNKSVDRLNDLLQMARWEGQEKHFTNFATDRGQVDLTVGDRIQVYGNHPKDGIFNGMVGTVTEATPDRITFLADGGAERCFCPEDFKKFGLGYAGTVYRGQGQTLPQTYALYDSKSAWNRRTTYVAMTRHKHAVELFVPRELAPDLDTLGRQMDRADDGDASLAWEAVGEEVMAAKGVTAAAQEPTPAAAPNLDTSTNTLDIRSDIILPTPATQVSTSRASAPTPKPDTAAMPIHIPAAPMSTVAEAGIVAAMSTMTSFSNAGSSRPTPARIAVIDAILFRAPLTTGARNYDLNLSADRDSLLKALQTEKMPVVVQIYDAIRRMGRDRNDARDVLEKLRGSITHDAKTRGFLPKDDKIWAECLCYFRFDPLDILPDPELSPGRGEVDIRSAVQPLLGDKPAVWRLLRERLRMLVPEALRNVYASLLEASARAAGNKKGDLQLTVINSAVFVYDTAYDLGVDLLPDDTQHRGHIATPEEFRRDILPMSRKAQNAGRPNFGVEEEPLETTSSAAPGEDEWPMSNSMTFDLYDEFRRHAFGRRLDGLIKNQEEKITALTGLSPQSFLQHYAVDESLDLEFAELQALQDRRKAFQVAPALLLERAQLIDFLPALVTEQDLAAWRARVKRPEQPDLATQIFEEQLRKHVWNAHRRRAAAESKPPKPVRPTTGAAAPHPVPISLAPSPAPNPVSTPRARRPRSQDDLEL